MRDALDEQGRKSDEEHERLGKHPQDAAHEQERPVRWFFLALHGRGLVSTLCYYELCG